MPELGEVEYYRKRWDPAVGYAIDAVSCHEGARIYKEVSAPEVRSALVGRVYCGSQRSGKRILMQFCRDVWLTLHLGMSGKLHCESEEYLATPHDHLIIRIRDVSLVFTDPRQFGRVELSLGSEPPAWWKQRPPEILDDAYTLDHMKTFLARHPRSLLKPILLDQKGFPGVGNWMADEILWRARIRPDCRVSLLLKDEDRLLAFYEALCEVAQDALEVIGSDFNDPPAHWLFNHRWRDGGHCPQTGTTLVREQVRGRTCCWSPAWQTWPQD